jgi:catecholate siderophore receptor
MLSTLLSNQAISQTVPVSDPNSFDDDVIVVTGKYLANEKFSAMKTRTPLIDVPQSLSVVSSEQIENQAFLEIGDILRYTPGASIGQGEGHRDQITIRGQNTTADFFIDGLRDDVQYFRPLYNLEQVEILRGSNALIFGRGGGGGVINRVTKSAIIDENFSTAMAGVDSFGAYNVSSDVNLGIEDRFGFRLNAFYESLNNHRDEFNGERFAINPTCTAQFSPNTKVKLSYEYVDDDRVVDRGVPSLNGAPLRGFDNTFFGDPDLNLTTLRAHIARGQIDHSFSDSLSFNATIQYADYDKLYQNLYPIGFDQDAGNVSLDGYRDATARQNFISQANLVYELDTAGIGHTVLIGAEYGDQQTGNNRRDSFFTDSSDDQISFLFSDPIVIPEVSFPVFSRNRASNVNFLSLYAQDQIDIGEFVKIVAGFRYDRFDINVADRIEANNGAADGNDGLLGRIDEEISPRVGLIVKPKENISLYASYSQSFLPRSGDQFLTLSLTNEALEPEKFENYEIGAKLDFNEDLSLTTSIFQLDRNSGTTVDPNNPENLILIGSLTKGFEITLNGQITANWSVNAGYSYLDAGERGRFVDGVSANRNLKQVPKHMFSLWNNYEVNKDLGIGLGVTHQAGQFASISNAVNLPAFTRVDVAVYYNVSERLQLQVNVENLLDTDYFPAAHNDNNISTGEPLNARFTIRAKF